MAPCIFVRTGKIEVSTHHICAVCGRQCVDVYAALPSYSDDVKATRLKMYVNCMGFRGIERVTDVHHTTVICWVKQVGENLPNAYEPECTPEVCELDELEMFIGSKKPKSGRQ